MTSTPSAGAKPATNTLAAMTPPRSTAAIARGVLLATFVGDALGARWEGAGATSLQQARHRLEQSLTADVLHYTDDTQLTLALAEHLCEHPHVEPEHLVATFLDHFEGHRGYARGMFGVVDAWNRGLAPADAATSVFPDGSFGNGAAMRVAPVGLVWRHDPMGLRAAAAAQAVLTHAHPIGIDAAVAQAAAVARAANTGAFTVDDLTAAAASADTDELRRTLGTAATVAAHYLEQRLPLPQVAETVGTGVLADQSVAAALWVAAVAEDVVSAVELSLGLGGDVDTIAAMACGVVGAGATDMAIPAEWLDRLEDGARGRGYARAVAERLATVADEVSAG